MFLTIYAGQTETSEKVMEDNPAIDLITMMFIPALNTIPMMRNGIAEITVTMALLLRPIQNTNMIEEAEHLLHLM